MLAFLVVVIDDHSQVMKHLLYCMTSQVITSVNSRRQTISDLFENSTGPFSLSSRP